MKTTKKLNDGRIKLTKNNINDGYIREFINKIEGSDKVLSDEELIEEDYDDIEEKVASSMDFVLKTTHRCPALCADGHVVRPQRSGRSKTAHRPAECRHRRA